MDPLAEREFRALVKRAVAENTPLHCDEARSIVTALLAAPDPLPESMALQTAALVTAMARRGETAEELCGVAEALRAAGLPLPLRADERAVLTDTCGTGGDGADTFNISTAAALVACGAGARIAKHGNRAVTGRCGSADVLEALGVPVALAPGAAAECLRTCGFVFLLAPMYHPAMRRVASLRRALPFRTIFNLAGPLANPAGAAAQLVGVADPLLLPVMAEALRLLGSEHAWVVHGGGLDELTTTGESTWAAVRGNQIRDGRLWPESLGLAVASLEELSGAEDTRGNARLIEQVLRGEDRTRGEITMLNAAAALVVSGLAPTLLEGLEQARKSVASGATCRVLESLRAFGESA